MPTYGPYKRKVSPDGHLAQPHAGTPAMTAGVLAALPGRRWRSRADGDEVYIDVVGAGLTAFEEAAVVQAHADWIPVNRDLGFALDSTRVALR